MKREGSKRALKEHMWKDSEMKEDMLGVLLVFIK